MADTNTYPARIGDVKAGFAAVKADVEQRMAQALAAVDSLADLLADVPPALASFGIQPYLPGLPNADQSAKVQAAMDAGVSNFANITVYINGALVWREGTVFRQRGSGEIFPKTQGFGDKQGAFIFGDSATRVFEQSLVLDDPLFVHVDAATPPQNTGNPTADTEAAKNRIAAWADNGLCARFLQDTVVTNGLFVGFYQGYKVHQERVRLINCRSDCLFDLEVSDASDCGYANNFHAYSFWIAHSPGIGADALRPYERGIWLRDDPDGNADKNDGFQINGGLVYGRKIGFDSENSYATRVVGLFVDGPPTLAAERETVGFRTGGDSNAVKISDCHAESVAIGFDLAHTGGHVRWMGNTASNIQTQPVRAGTGHSTGTIDLSNTGTNSVVKGLDSVGQHDVDVTLVGGTVTRLVDTDAVTTDKSRLRVRLAKSIGAATIDNGVGGQGWLEPVVPFTESIAQSRTLSPIGQIAVLGGTRTSDSPSAGSMGAQALTGIALNNNTTQIQTAYALYLESRRTAGAGTTHVGELNGLNAGTVEDVNPASMTPTGSSPVLWLSAGRGDVPGMSSNLSAALGVHNNGTRFKRGIVFGATALDAALSEAVAMDVTHRLAWYAGAARLSDFSGTSASLRVHSATTPYNFDLIRGGAGGADPADGDLLGRYRFYGLVSGTPSLLAYSQAAKRGALGGAGYTFAAMNDSATMVAVGLHTYGNNSFAPSDVIALGTAANPWGTVTCGSIVPRIANTFSVGTAAARYLNLYGNPIVVIRTLTSGATMTGNTTDYLMSINKASGSATAVILPASPEDGRTIIVKDTKGDAATNNITITPAAGTIDGAASLVINTNRGVARLTYSTAATAWLAI